MLVYHGMGPESVEEVLRDGLRVGKRWHISPPSVYFTKNADNAHFYGSLARSLAGVYVIVELEIPDDIKIIYDHNDDGLGLTESYRIEHDVPVSWIRGIEVYDTNYRELSARLKFMKMSEARKTRAKLKRLIGSHDFNLR